MRATLRPLVVPVGLLVVLVLSFGMLIPWLGFYWDDWSMVMVARLRGLAGFWGFYQFDRPLSAWTLYVSLPLLGLHPAAWQVFTLGLRWLTTLALWWALRGVWPNRPREVTLAAFLFAIYPIFTEQAVSVAFSQHWLCYFLYALSLGMMIWAQRRPRWFVPLTIGALLAALLQMFTLEYFVGLELLRPVFLWIILSERNSSLKDRLVETARRWWPYLLALLSFVVWRMFLLKLPTADRNAPTLVYNFLSTPLAALLGFVQVMVEDLAVMLVGVWAEMFSTGAILNLFDRFNLLSWVLGMFVAGGLALFLSVWFRPAPGDQAPTGSLPARPWHQTAVWIGLLAMVLGMLPVWVTGRQVAVGAHSDRLGLPAMFGASLFVVGLMGWLVRSRLKQIVLISLLIGIAAGQHLRTANDYRWSWVEQVRFYEQLAWRAPALQPGTAIFADGEIIPYLPADATSAAINVLYPHDGLSPTRLSAFFYSLGRDFSYQMPDFLSGMPVRETTHRDFSFNGSTLQAVVIDYNPDQNDCLHVLTPADASLPDLPAVTAQALPRARTDLIGAIAAPGYPPAEVFGSPSAQPDWCRLYEQADLARQLGDWQQVVSLAEQAAGQGYSIANDRSNTPFEWLPFIEGYARVGQWQAADRLTQSVLAKDPRMDVRVCQLWSKISDDLRQSGQPSQPAHDLLVQLDCLP